MKCIVTGAAGFIGSHLCDLLLSEGHEVIGVDDFSTGRASNLELAQANRRFRLVHKSVTKVVASDVGESSVDWVFHLAGRADLVPSIQKPDEYFTVNVEGTFRILELARALGVSRFLYTASSTCYGIADVVPTPETFPCMPRHPYGLTKYLGEQLAMHWYLVYKLPVVSLRLFNVYGPRSRTTGAYGAVFGVFLKQKLADKAFTVVGDGQQTRDFTFVTDVAEAFLATAKSAVAGEVMNVGSGCTYSINRLVGLLGGEVVHVPKRPGEPDSTFAEISRIRQRVGWKPRVDFVTGVGRMLDVIEDWRDAPLWDPQSIADATKDWFKYIGGSRTISLNHYEC